MQVVFIIFVVFIVTTFAIFTAAYDAGFSFFTCSITMTFEFFFAVSPFIRRLFFQLYFFLFNIQVFITHLGCFHVEIHNVNLFISTHIWGRNIFDVSTSFHCCAYFIGNFEEYLCLLISQGKLARVRIFHV